MKIALAFATILLLGGLVNGQQPTTYMNLPSKLGTSANLKRFNVTICRFDPKKGLESGEDFVWPVDSPDEEHAISSTLANAVSWTAKPQNGTMLSVAFCCTGIQGCQ